MKMTEKQQETPGEPVEISYGIGSSTLGAVLLAATAAGVCAVLLADRPEDLVAELRERFPVSRIRPDPAALEGWLKKAVALIDRPAKGFDVPLDLHGSDFQRRVWQALREVPPGATASYDEIAHRLGQPGSARAVAGACAANPLAVAVPCHRVVRGDGSLAGYRWGVERKRALLAREQVREQAR